VTGEAAADSEQDYPPFNSKKGKKEKKKGKKKKRKWKEFKFKKR